MNGRRYRRIPEEADGALLSDTLGVAFRSEGARLRLTDLETGAPLLRPGEEAEARRRAQEERLQADRARQEAEEARRKAEERVRALEAEIARLRGQ